MNDEVLGRIFLVSGFGDQGVYFRVEQYSLWSRLLLAEIVDHRVDLDWRFAKVASLDFHC